MPTLPESRNELVIADLPFGVSGYKWDLPVCLNQFWKTVGERTTIAFANLRFMRDLIASNEKAFRYELVWDQIRGWTPLLAKKMPMRSHQYVCLFGRRSLIYNPQKTEGHKRIRSVDGQSPDTFYKRNKTEGWTYDSSERYPTTVLRIPPDKKTRNNKTGTRKFTPTHPSAKPVALLSWLIKSFSPQTACVIDPTAGSASTAIAALASSRSVVCIEKDTTYFDSSVERVRKHVTDNKIDATIEVRR